MPKQYTFKTTRTTEWMEEVLDSLPPSERSRFIRKAISEKISGNSKVIQSDTLSYNESPKGNTLYDLENVGIINTNTPPPSIFKTIDKDDDVDLDEKLRDISKIFG